MGQGRPAAAWKQAVAGFSYLDDWSDEMTLNEWLDKSGCYCQDRNGAKIVHLGRVVKGEVSWMLWKLVDYVCSSVCGEVVVMVPRREKLEG